MTPLHIEFDREDDGRWIAEIPSLPGVLAYGASQEEAAQHVQALANVREAISLSLEPVDDGNC